MAVTGDIGGQSVTLNNAAEENTLQDIKSLLGQTTKAANINANNINSANVAAGKAAGGLKSVANSSGYASKSLDNASASVRKWSKDARENISMATTAFGRAVTTTGTSLSSRLDAVGGAASTAAKSIPYLGTALGAGIGIVMGQVSGLVSTYEKAQASGGSFGNSMQEFMNISNEARLTMGQLANITQVAGKDLALFGGTTATGGRLFASFNKDLRNAPVSNQLLRMGMSIEQQGIAMAEYTGSLARYGADLQSINPGEVTKGMADLTRQQKMFAAINGTTLDQERQKSKQQAMDIDSRTALLAVDKKDRVAAAEYIKQMEAQYGASGAQFAKEVLVHGQAVSQNANMFATQFSAVSGPMADLGKSFRNGGATIEDISNAMGNVDQTAFESQLADAGKVAALTVGTGLSNGFTEMIRNSLVPLLDAETRLRTGVFANAKADSDAVAKAAQGLDKALSTLPEAMQAGALLIQKSTAELMQTDGATAIADGIATGAAKFSKGIEAFTASLEKGSTFTHALSEFVATVSGTKGGGQKNVAQDIAKLVVELLADDIPGKAIGGPVGPNSLSFVGEQGPELLQMGGQGGNVIPNSGFNQLMGGLGQQIAQLQQMDLEKSMRSLGDGDSAGRDVLERRPTASILDQETKDAIMALPSIMSANIDAIVNADQNTQDGLKDLSRYIA